MDSNTENAVKVAVTDFTNKGMMFSAFDVTKKLRKYGVAVFHSEARKVVHDLFSNSEMPMDYTRSNFSLSNGRVTVVYHSQYQDVNTYDPDNVDSSTPQSAAPQGQTAPTPPCVQSPVQQSFGRGTRIVKTGGRDARGRYCVSNKLTKQVGILPHENISVYVYNSKVTIQRYGSCKAVPVRAILHNLVVDKDTNIRLSPGILKEAGLCTSDLKAEVSNGEIEVSAK